MTEGLLIVILISLGLAIICAYKLGERRGFIRGASDYEHHLRYPVAESHRHYPAGPWDQYRS